MDGSDGAVNQQLQSIKNLLPNLLPKCGQSVVITIDGPAGSGKTTLAQELESILEPSYTIHMDDLFEGWQSTLTPTLTGKLSEILTTVKLENRIRFTPYSWLESKLAPEIARPAPKYLILEGVGSGQSAIRDFISLALWIEVLPGIGLERVIRRDGMAVAPFMPDFITAQNIHFEKEATKKSADYRLSGQGTV